MLNTCPLMEESCNFIDNKAEAIREEILSAISEDLDRGDCVVDVARCNECESMSPCVKLHAFKLLREYGVSLSLGV